MTKETGLTKEFLEKVLKTGIERFESGQGTKLGDGYMCSLLKATVWTKAEPQVPVSIVVKCFPENEARRAELDQGNVFETELRFYDTIISEFQRLQEELLENKRFLLPFAPFINGNYIPVERREELLGRRLSQLDNFIILPDLRVESNGAFRVRDRFLGFDLDHQRLVMEAQATLHAISWVYKCRRKGESLLKSFPVLNSNDIEQRKSFSQHFGTSISVIEKLFAEKNPEFSEGIERLKRIYGPVYGLYSDFENGQQERGLTKDNVCRVPGAVVENEEPWEVLHHGDCWSNNLMFRYDEKTGKPIQVLLIDLQLSREGDPTADMSFSLCFNPEPLVRRKHLTSILHTYYDRFTEICDAFSVPYLPGWSFEELRRRFRRSTLMGTLLTSMMPFVLKEEDQLEDLDEAYDKRRMENGNSAEEPQDAMKEFFDVEKISQKMHPSVLARLTALMEDLIEDQVL